MLFVGRIFVAVLFCVCLTCFFGCPTKVSASVNSQPDHVLLAITCWHEGGFWDEETNEFARVADCAAIAAAIQNMADRRSLSFARAWRRSSPRLARGEVERSWMVNLNETGDYPSGFDHDLPWERIWRWRWLNLVEVSRQILSGEINHSCVASPHTWGTYSDIVANRIRFDRRWCEIECGDTSNHFGEWILHPRDRRQITRRYGHRCR